MIVEVVGRGLLASSACGRPYNNDAEFPSCRASRPSCNAGRDHRVATSIDRAPTKSNVSATDAHSDGPLPLGLSVTTLVGLAFRPNHRQARNSWAEAFPFVAFPAATQSHRTQNQQPVQRDRASRPSWDCRQKPRKSEKKYRGLNLLESEAYY